MNKKLMVTWFAFIAVIAIIFSVSINDSDSTATKWMGKQDISQKSEMKQIAIPGVSDLIFESGEISQKVNLYNPEQNDCQMVFTIIVDEKEIWKSGKTEPGYGYYEIELSEPFEKGNYVGTLLCECSRNGEKLNSAKMKVRIIAE